MGKKGKCTYCRKFSDNLTVDHVFAGSWYPANTPQTVQRWTVRACFKCNNELSDVEEYLFLRLSRQLNPQNPLFQDLIVRAHRAVDPSAATDPKDRIARQKKLDQLNADVVQMTGVDPKKTFPSLNQPASSVGLRFSKAMSDRFQEKVVRGASLKLYNRVIDPPAGIRLYNVHASDVVGDAAFLDARLSSWEIGEGFEVAHGQAADDDQVLIFRITIWGVYRFYALVAPQGFEDQPDE
jgi:hypothetical protein